MTDGPGGAPTDGRIEPLGAPADPLRPTGRVRAAPSAGPSRGPDERTRTMLYVLVALGVLVLASLALYGLFGVNLVPDAVAEPRA